MVPLGKVCFKFQTNTVKYQTSIVCGQQKAITVSRRITILSFACPGLSPSWVVRLGLKYSQKVHLDGLFFFLLPGTHCYTILPYLILWPPLVQRHKLQNPFFKISLSSCTQMFMAALSIIANKWEQSKGPPTAEWIKKMWSTRMRE